MSITMDICQHKERTMTTKAKPAGPDLGDLPQKITAAVTAMNADAGKAARKALDHANTLGGMFTAVKARMPHGGWEDWIKDHTGLKRSTVKNYRDISAGWKLVSEHGDFGPTTSIRTALEWLGKLKKKKSGSSTVSDDRIKAVIDRPEFAKHKLTPAVVHQLLAALGVEKPADAQGDDNPPQPAKPTTKPTRRAKANTPTTAA